MNRVLMATSGPARSRRRLRVFTVSSLELNGGTPVTFKVSTNGFKAALERAARLAS